MPGSARWSVPLAALFLLLAGRATAEPHTRGGVCAGFGFGLESVSWRDLGGDRSADFSGVMDLRVARSVGSNLMVGLEFWGWARDDEVHAGTGSPVSVRLGVLALAATYYPGGGGWFMRLGAGLAHGRVEYEALVPARRDATGIAVLVAPGYEWRLTPRFALGAQGDVAYLGLQSGPEDPFGYGVTAQFNWYW